MYSGGFYYTEDGEKGVSQEADIHLEIINDGGESVYKKTTHVTEEDYSMWTYNFTNEDVLLGHLFIPTSDIDKGNEKTGQLKLSASLPSGSAFEPVELYVYDLPLEDLSITTPEYPITVNNYDYYGNIKTTAEISKITYEYDYSATMEIVITMTFNKDGDSEDDYFDVPYKIKDSDGVIVDSGTVLCGPLSVGDTIKEQTYLGNVELGETYSIEFLDAK